MKPLTRARLAIGAPSQSADLRFLTGFQAVDPLVFVDTGYKQYLIVPDLELGRALEQVRKPIRAITPGTIAPHLAQTGDRLRWAMALLRRERVRNVAVPSWTPVSVVRGLQRRGLRVRIHEGPFAPERIKKNRAELQYIACAQRAATRAMQRAVKILREASIRADGHLVWAGRILTAERVRQAIEEELLRADCVADETIVACGTQSANPHERGHGALRAGEPIVLDIFPRHRPSGYWGDLTRTVVRGRATDEVKRMYRAVRSAHAAALRVLRPGVKAARVHEAAERALLEQGFRTTRTGSEPEGFIHNTGHGVGLEIHERPSLGPGTARVGAGNVVTVEPGLYYRRVGGVRVEDLVVVTRTGPRILVPCPYWFELGKTR